MCCGCCSAEAGSKWAIAQLVCMVAIVGVNLWLATSDNIVNTVTLDDLGSYGENFPFPRTADIGTVIIVLCVLVAICMGGSGGLTLYDPQTDMISVVFGAFAAVINAVMIFLCERKPAAPTPHGGCPAGPDHILSIDENQILVVTVGF